MLGTSALGQTSLAGYAVYGAPAGPATYIDIIARVDITSSFLAIVTVVPPPIPAVGVRTYPPTINLPSNLFVAANNKKTTLAASLSIDALELTLTDASTWPSSGAVSLDAAFPGDRTLDSSEVVYFNGRVGNVLTLESRGEGGTTAKAWSSGVSAEMRVTAEHHNILADGLIAVETELETKADIGHSHTQGDVADLEVALADKADAVHIHEISDVTGLEDALNAAGVGSSIAVYNVQSYGASASQTADANRAAFQAAIDACPEFGTVWIPRVTGGYTIGGTGSQLLLVNKNIHILGEHAAGVGATASSPATGGSILLIHSGVSASTDVIRIAGTSRHNHQKVMGLQFRAASGTPARHALHLDLTNASHWQWMMQIKYNWFATLGGRSIYLNNPSNVDGFFASTISENVIEAGMSLLRCGDSVWIMRNQFWGYGLPQSSAAAIDLSVVPGAACITIRDNNCTAKGGFIRAVSGEQLIIEGNQIEQTFATTMPEVAMIALLGSTATHTRSRINGNNMNAHSMTTWHVLLGAANDTEIHSNTMMEGGGISIGASSTGTRLGYNVGATVANSGTDTKQISYVAL